MVRYLLFAYSDFYPRGGWNDFICSFNDLVTVLDFSNDMIENKVGENYVIFGKIYKYFHIVDIV